MASAEGLKALAGDEGRLALVGALLVVGTYWVYHSHVVLGAEVHFVELFYIPIILACFWWRRYGLVVAAYLSALLLSSHLIFLSDVPLVYDVVRAVMFVAVGGVFAVLSELLERREGELRTLLDDVIDTSGVGILVLDSSFRVVWVNRAVELYFGIRKGELIGKDKRQLIEEKIKHVFEQPERFAKRVLATYEDNTYIEHFECHVLAGQGREERWLEHWSQPIRSGLYAGGRVEHYIDITERKEAEEKLDYLNSVLRAIRSINQLITRERDTQALLHGICSRLVEARGYHSAWCVLLDDGKLLAGAHANLKEQFSAFLEKMGRGELVPCAKRSLEEAGAVVITDTSKCEGCPLSSTYAEGEGAMVIRLEHEGRVYGLLGVHTPLGFAGYPEEQALFEEVAGDIGFALYSIEQREERKKAWERLESLQKELQLMLDSVPAMIFYKDRENRLIHVNRCFADTMGLPKEKLEGKSCFDVYSYQQAEAYWQDDKEVMASRKPKRGIIEPLETASGTRWIQTDKLPLEDEEGNIIGVIGFAIDITERKEAEEELKQSEQRYRELANMLPQTVFEIDTDGRLTFVNRNGLVQFGYTQQDLERGINALQVFAPEDRERARQNLERVLNGEEGGTNEYTALRKDGSTFPVVIHSSPIVRDGRVVGVRGIAVDITEQKELEEMKRRAYDQLETNIEIFATLVDGIRNPLAVISGYAELAGDERGRKILNQCERINKIIKQFDEGWLESEKVRDFLRRHM